MALRTTVRPSRDCILLEEKVLKTLKGSISATYLEPLKGSIQKPF